MAISHECECGAPITMPNLAAGRLARCKSCGLIFRVPQPYWQRELAFDNATPDGQRGRAGGVPVTIPAMPKRSAPAPGLPVGPKRDRRAERSRPSFWGDAAWSFLFFRNGSNLTTLALICIMYTLLVVLARVFLIGLLAWGLQPFFLAWLCVFYLNVVKETAHGEDVLSTPNLSDMFEDFIRPFFRFVGCWLIALAPAFVFTWLAASGGGDVPWHVVGIIAAAGVFLWPVLILGAAIGDQLPLRSLPLLIQTVLRAPFAYLAVWLLVGLAGGIAVATTMWATGPLRSWFGPDVPLIAMAVVVLIAKAVEVYAWIVAMRQIGLYYRHFKSQFPWRAE